ncbi:MAG: hypothetical protein ABIB43_05940 [archaeon]
MIEESPFYRPSNELMDMILGSDNKYTCGDFNRDMNSVENLLTLVADDARKRHKSDMIPAEVSGERDMPAADLAALVLADLKAQIGDNFDLVMLKYMDCEIEQENYSFMYINKDKQLNPLTKKMFHKAFGFEEKIYDKFAEEYYEHAKRHTDWNYMKFEDVEGDIYIVSKNKVKRPVVNLTSKVVLTQMPEA